MPIYKPRLNPVEEATRLDCLRQLQAEGVDVEIPEEWLENSRAINIVVAGPGENTVLETTNGGVFYAVLARLIAVRPGTLTECALSTAYDDQIVLESFVDGNPVCNFGGQMYSRREILNQRIENGLRLSRGQVVEGWVLAKGLQRVPIKYGNLAVPFEVVLWDQFGNENSADGRISVLRSQQREKTSVWRGTGLDGLDAMQEPRELSPSEESQRRYRELVAQESSGRE